MRRAWMLTPLVLLTLTACLPNPVAQQTQDPPPGPTISTVPVPATAAPDPSADSAALYEELAASVETGDGVTSVEASDDGYGPVFRVEVADDIDRAALQAIVDTIRDTSESLGIDMTECLCSIDSDATYSGTLAWLYGELPSDTTGLFDGWEWLSGFSNEYVPEMTLSSYGSIDAYAEADDTSWAPDFLAGVTEDGAVADLLGDEVYGFEFNTVDDYERCVTLAVNAPVEPEVADLITSLVTEGIGDTEALCLDLYVDDYGIGVYSVSELGEDADAQLLADVVAAFEEIDVEVLF